jgi:uncharacterized protein
MWINVSQQLKASIGSWRSYKVNENIDISGNTSKVQGKVELVRTDRGILVKGTLQTEVEIACSRCLSSFSCPLTLSIEEEYFPVTDVVSGAALPLPEETSCFTIDEYHVIDLTEAIRQYTLMAIPMKPLCREDCAGLCSNCGQNLNRISCCCQLKEKDSRWSEVNKLTLASDVVVSEQKGME